MPRPRLAAGARYLALDGRLDVVTIGRRRAEGPRDADVTIARFPAGAVDPATARRHLHQLVDLYDRGMCEPLPMYCATSAAYAAAVGIGRPGGPAARKQWESDRFPGEDVEPEHTLVLGGVVRFDDLLDDEPETS